MNPHLPPMLLIVCAVIFAIVEVRRWSSSPDLLSQKQRRIRSAGFILLVLSLSLWLHGTYIPDPPTHHKPLTREAKEAAAYWLGYWGFTCLTLVPIPFLAILDARENLRRASEQRRNLLQEVLAPTESGTSAES